MLHLRALSFATQDTLTTIRTTQSTEAAKRSQQVAIDLFFPGREILPLLHPQMLLLHIRTKVANTLVAEDPSACLEQFLVQLQDLGLCEGVYGLKTASL